jgi:hypothetical protein
MIHWIRENVGQATMAVVSIIVIVIGVAIIFGGGGSSSGTGDNTTGQTWFYDTVTGDYFRASYRQAPPIQSPAGNPAVAAAMFTCGGCGAGERFAAYYFKLTDDVKRQVDANPAMIDAVLGEAGTGRLYSLDAKTWVEAANPDAAGMLKPLQTRCTSGALKRCP